MYSSLMTLVSVGFVGLAAARPQASTTAATTAAACTVPAPKCTSPGPQTTYLPEPCFPNTGVCYPTTYYAAQDQGQFSIKNGPFDAQIKAKCQAVCDSQAQCASFVGTENITPDGTLATSTCFFYSMQLLSPRQCADAPSRIIAYYKQKVCPVVVSTTTSSSTTKSTTSTTKSTTSTTKSTTSTTKSTTATTTSTSSTTKSTTTTTTSSSTTSSSTTTSSTTSSTTTSSTTTSSTTTSSTTTSSTTTSSTTTSSTTTSSTTSSTTTAPAPTSTVCTAAQNDYCDSYAGGRTCTCAVSVDRTRAYCWGVAVCESCNSDADCGSESRCAYDSSNECSDAGGTFCVYNDTQCGSGTPPAGSAKRDLEKVFENAGRRGYEQTSSEGRFSRAHVKF